MSLSVKGKSMLLDVLVPNIGPVQVLRPSSMHSCRMKCSAQHSSKVFRIRRPLPEHSEMNMSMLTRSAACNVAAIRSATPLMFVSACVILVFVSTPTSDDAPIHVKVVCGLLCKIKRANSSVWCVPSPMGGGWRPPEELCARSS